MSAFVLPPAGDRIVLTPQPEHARALETGDEHWVWVDSGTSALATCLAQIKEDLGADDAEVIVPGYCCPDIVAAVNYCQLRPVAVDLARDRTDYDLDKLRASFSPRTIAIIAPNFLGIACDLAAIRGALPHDSTVRLIEDNAQWFPAVPFSGSAEADYRIFSFGRGKPVTLLGGGVAISRHPLPATAPVAQGALARLMSAGKIRLYNQLSRPGLYRLLARNTYLRLGATEYHPLPGISPMDGYRHALLPANIDRYRARDTGVQDYLVTALAAVNQLGGLAGASAGRLLRYPLLLASGAERDALYKALTEQGLGASKLYQSAITDVPGVPELTVRAPLDNATGFAQRLLTLPTHDKVSLVHAQAIVRVTERILSR